VLAASTGARRDPSGSAATDCATDRCGFGAVERPIGRYGTTVGERKIKRRDSEPVAHRRIHSSELLFRKGAAYPDRDRYKNWKTNRSYNSRSVQTS